ncbi:DUF1947 domain-containing protein [Candidatus Woesearchaeota archaeon]|nr:DUF1947 domain-containing protein [Candidatus Woesearchaeota archaeon]
MRTRIRSKDVKLQLYGLELSKKDIIEVLDDKFLIINNEISFFRYEERWVPTLKYLAAHPILKRITIDMGAIRFIVSGADVMRPGITEIQEGIQRDDIVVVVDQTHQKPIAVGIASFNFEEMKVMKTGKVIKNIHYVGDEVWKA